MTLLNNFQGEAQLSFLESVAEEGEAEVKQKRVQIDVMDDSGRVSNIQEEQQFEDRRSVNSSRLPTATMTRARLVRTPANKDDVPPQSPEPPEHREPHTPDILITELKDPPELVEGESLDEESDIEPEYKQVTVETVDAEEDWETDLEIEGNAFYTRQFIFLLI